MLTYQVLSLADCARFASLGKQDDFTSSLVGSHSHEMAMAAMGLTAVLVAQQFGYPILMGASRLTAGRGSAGQDQCEHTEHEGQPAEADRRAPGRRLGMGTVGLISVGMFGRGAGRGIAPMLHPLTLVVGGLARKPGLVDGQVEEREYLCLTLTQEHDLIDGAPAARPAERLKEVIEGGAGLRDHDGAPASEGALL